MGKPQSGLSALFAKSAFEFSGKATTLSTARITPQAFTCGASRALIRAAVWCRGPRWVGASEKGELGRPLRKAHRVLVQSDGGQGALCVFITGKGPQGVGRRKTYLRDHPQRKEKHATSKSGRDPYACSSSNRCVRRANERYAANAGQTHQSTIGGGYQCGA